MAGGGGREGFLKGSERPETGILMGLSGGVIALPGSTFLPRKKK